QLADAYTAATKKQWTQPIGFVHALFEVSIDSLKRAKDVGDKTAVRDALAATNLATIVGPVAWGKGPVKNVTRTPLVGGQWVRGKQYKYELIVVDDRTAPAIPTAGKLQLLGRSAWAGRRAGGRGRLAPSGARPADGAAGARGRGKVVRRRPRRRPGHAVDRGRGGARHHRPQRRRQDHAVQPDRWRRATGFRRDPLPRRRRHRPAPPPAEAPGARPLLPDPASLRRHAGGRAPARPRHRPLTPR